MDELTNLTKNHLREILKTCEEELGMQLPFVLCAASPNGSVLCICVHGGDAEPEALAEHFEPEGFTVPITCTLLDRTGSAFRITITAESRLVSLSVPGVTALGSSSSPPASSQRCQGYGTIDATPMPPRRSPP